MVGDINALTAAVVTLKVALVAPAGMVTLAATCAAALLLDRLTETPPLGAGPLSVTVPVEPCPPVTIEGLMLTACKAEELFTVKVAVSVSVAPLDSLTNCVMVCVPFATAVVFQGLAALVRLLPVDPAKS